MLLTTLSFTLNPLVFRLADNGKFNTLALRVNAEFSQSCNATVKVYDTCPYSPTARKVLYV